VPVELRGEDLLIRLGDREYRVRGLQKNTSADLLRRHGALHVNTSELNASRQRMAFVKQAEEELRIKEEIVRRDVGKGVVEARRAEGRADIRGRYNQPIWLPYVASPLLLGQGFGFCASE